MKMLLQFVRIATTACYFLPFTFLFVTCSGNNSKTPFDFAYNKEDAAEDAIKDKDSGWFGGLDSTKTDTASTTAPLIDSANQSKGNGTNVDTNKTVVQDISSTTTIMDKLNTLFGAVAWIMVKPSETSETALGVILISYKTLFGIIDIAASLLLSLTIFIIGCFKKHNNRLILVLTTVNLLSITVFIIDALINSVQILYGAWLCLALIACSVTLQYWQVKRPTAI